MKTFVSYVYGESAILGLQPYNNNVYVPRVGETIRFMSGGLNKVLRVKHIETCISDEGIIINIVLTSSKD